MADVALHLPDYWVEERAKRAGIPIYDLLPQQYARTILPANSRSDVNDVAYRAGGRAAKPTRDVVIVGPDGHTPIVVCGWGVTEGAELEETAQAAYEKQEARLRAGKDAVDFDELRARRGLPSREKAGQAMREAIDRRIARHKANPVTDPQRQPRYPLRGYHQGVDAPAKDS